MKKFFIEYILYVYQNFLKDDDLIYVKKWALLFMKILLFFHKGYMIITSVVFFPFLVLDMKSRNLINKKLNI